MFFFLFLFEKRVSRLFCLPLSLAFFSQSLLFPPPLPPHLIGHPVTDAGEERLLHEHRLQRPPRLPLVDFPERLGEVSRHRASLRTSLPAGSLAATADAGRTSCTRPNLRGSQKATLTSPGDRESSILQKRGGH